MTKKIIFIEGLPNVGKTYLINKIKEEYGNSFKIVEEIINPEIKNLFSDNEKIFMRNDEQKIKKYDDGTIIIDRGPISTLTYNQVKHIINNEYDSSFIEKWFEKFKKLYKETNTYIYYLYNPNEYIPSIKDNSNPFGSIENLKLTHAITTYNLHKYSKNFKIIIYNKKNLEEVINEIIN